MASRSAWLSKYSAGERRPAPSYEWFLVWSDHMGTTEDYAVRLEALTAECAALQWVEDMDLASWDGAILTAAGAPSVVFVRRESDGQLTTWHVSGEMVPQYQAEQVAPEDDATEEGEGPEDWER